MEGAALMFLRHSLHSCKRGQRCACTGQLQMHRCTPLDGMQCNALLRLACLGAPAPNICLQCYVYMTTVGVSPDHKVATVGYISTACFCAVIHAVACGHIGLVWKRLEHLFFMHCQLSQHGLVSASDLLDDQLLAWPDASWQLHPLQISITPGSSPAHAHRGGVSHMTWCAAAQSVGASTSSKCCSNSSTYSPNSVGLTGHPCFTPMRHLNMADMPSDGRTGQHWLALVSTTG